LAAHSTSRSLAHPGPPFIARLVGVETRYQAKFALWGYLFLSPWLIGLIVFVIGPILASLYLSLTDYNIVSPPKFVGLANFQTAFFKDNLF
jgi:multiple sugar transport system permease protein